MRTIKWTCGNGLVNAKISGEFDVDDDMSDAEINEIAVAELWDHLDFTWDEVDG